MLTLNTLQITALVVCLTAVAFVIFASWMLLRIYHHTESSRLEVQDFLRQIREETRSYRNTESAFASTIERANKLFDDIDPARWSGQLEEIAHHIATGRLSPEMAVIAQEGFDTLQEIADTAPEQLASWQSNNQHELNRLLAQKGRLEAELDQTRGKLHESDRQIRELRRQNRDAEVAESAAEQLRNVNQRLIGDLREARRRALELESKLQPVTLELQKTKARLAAQPQGKNDSILDLEAENKVLLERSALMDAAVRRLEEEAENNREELSRALREKSFIEERFLEIDGA